MYARTGVLSEVELQARNEVKWEMYTKKVQIEARVLGDLALNHIIPVATRYQSLLVNNVVNLRSLFDGEKGARVVGHDIETIEKISGLMDSIKNEVERMVTARKQANAISDERSRAIAYHDNVVPPMEIIRHHIDKLEMMIDNGMWPLPKYRELLFIR